MNSQGKFYSAMFQNISISPRVNSGDNDLPNDVRPEAVIRKIFL